MKSGSGKYKYGRDRVSGTQFKETPRYNKHIYQTQPHNFKYMEEELARQLERWRKKSFHSEGMSLADLVANLEGNENDLVDIVPNKSGNVWTVSRRHPYSDIIGN